MNQKSKPELLAPAGNLETLKIAFAYGANAVYCGTPAFAMRARVGFDFESLAEGIEYAHKLKKKVYLTLNAFPHPDVIEELKKHINKLIALKPDAFIVADPGMVDFLVNNYDIPVHLSTQASTTNQLAANFWKKIGVERIVLARELSLDEIKTISDQSKVEIECFVHGAMCMAYSGRCQISNYLTGRDPNQGQCIQACRFKYKMYALEEDLRKDEYFPIYEDEEGTHILNSKDLCMIENIDQMIEAGITSLKIEGRLKSEYYVATVVRAYRMAIDDYFTDKSLYQQNKSSYLEDIKKTANRGLTTGFYFNKPDQNTNNYKSSKADSTWGYIGRVTESHEQEKTMTFICKNYLEIEDHLEIITPTDTYSLDLTEMSVNGEPVKIAHADNLVTISFDHKVTTDTFLRKEIKK
ncbi:MAG: U32 family peptidase C-terminal domain-containing protein [Candidatus Berkelbacteria bacterium]